MPAECVNTAPVQTGAARTNDAVPEQSEAVGVVPTQHRTRAVSSLPDVCKQSSNACTKTDGLADFDQGAFECADPTDGMSVLEAETGAGTKTGVRAAATKQEATKKWKAVTGRLSRPTTKQPDNSNLTASRHDTPAYPIRNSNVCDNKPTRQTLRFCCQTKPGRQACPRLTHGGAPARYSFRQYDSRSIKTASKPFWSGSRTDPYVRLLRPVSGGHSGGVPPVPIPNTVVKAACANDTCGATRRENRSPPE